LIRVRLSFFKSAAGERFCCRPLALDEAEIFVASRLPPPLHGLWQPVLQVRRGEELHEFRADASVASGA